MTPTSIAIRGLARRQQSLHILSGVRCLSYSKSPPARFDDIAVVGGGITGLGAAYFAAKKNPEAKITLYEQTDRFGGWLKSWRHNVPGDGGSVLFEAGPRTLRPAGNGRLMLAVMMDLGMEKDLISLEKSSPHAANRYIYYPDHLVQIATPPRPGWANDLYNTIYTEDAFQGLTMAALTEWAKQPRPQDLEDESIGDFMSRRLNRNLVDRLASAIFHGIYAGNVWQLSARSLLRGAWRQEGRHGSLTKGAILRMMNRAHPVASSLDLDFELFLQDQGDLGSEFRSAIGSASIFTFRNGLSQLGESLFAWLKQRPNVTIVSSAGVREVSRVGEKLQLEFRMPDLPRRQAQHGHMIYTGSPDGLRSFNASARTELPAINSETVMTVNLYYKTPDMTPHGFGYLIPLAVPFEQNPEHALGVVFDSSYSNGPEDTVPGLQGPHQDTTGSRGTKLTVMLGGHYWDGWPTLPSEEEGLRMAKQVVKRHLNIEQEPLVSAVNLQKDCIPRYEVGHHKKLEKVQKWIYRNYGGRLLVAGSWINGVGVNDCLRSAWNAVNFIDDYSSTNLEHVIDDGWESPNSRS